jgi:hypothetical protein
MIRKIPNQFTKLGKLFDALSLANRLINDGIPLTDENYGTEIIRDGIRNPRNKNIPLDEFFQIQQEKAPGDRSHYSTARGTKEFFALLGFLTLDEEKNGTLSPIAIQLLEAGPEDESKAIWKTALLQLTLEAGGQTSHPYRILLRLVNTFPGIETSKLLLALEAENDSEEEFERISAFVELNLEEIIQSIGTSKSRADNAVKILPGIAEQLGDIERIGSGVERRAFPINQIVTEDGIITEGQTETARRSAPIRKVTSEAIAPTPNFQDIPSANIDPTEANRMRQRRFTEHQEIVRLLGRINEEQGFELFEDRFDCVATKNNTALLYEVKTILESFTDQEKQTLTAVGQLKYYEFSEVRRKWHGANIKQVIVFSQKPNSVVLEFCSAENITVIWQNGNGFQIYNPQTSLDELFNPDDLL